MSGAIPPLPQHALMAAVQLKHRDNFTFSFTLYRYGSKIKETLMCLWVKIETRFTEIILGGKRPDRDSLGELGINLEDWC
jgi:hypothetical protein